MVERSVSRAGSAQNSPPTKKGLFVDTLKGYHAFLRKTLGFSYLRGLPETAKPPSEQVMQETKKSDAD
jgi:hypothetical protein